MIKLADLRKLPLVTLQVIVPVPPEAATEAL